MKEIDRETARKLAEMFAALPDSKKERILGYAEGVADMARRAEADGDAVQSA